MAKAMGLRLQCLIYMCALFSASLYAGEDLSPVRLFSKNQYVLSTSMEVFEDKTNNLTIDDVASPKFKGLFSPNTDVIANFGVSTSTYWVRTSVVYPDSYPNVDEVTHWYLEVGDAQMDEAELYISEFDGVFSIQMSDLREPYDLRPVKHVNSVFPIDISLGESLVFYIKVNKTTSMRFPLVLWTQQGFVENVANEEFLYGLLYGSMFILMIYNIFLYVATKDVSYFYYVNYLLSVSVFMFLELGHGLIHFEEYFGKVHRESIIYFIWFSVISGSLFTRSFLNTRIEFPKIDAVLVGFIAVAIVSIVINELHIYHVSVAWTSMFNSILMPTFLSMVFYTYIQGNKSAKFFFMAWIFNVVGFFVLAVATSEFISMTPFVIAATPIGILMESLLFSFALAHRIKNEQSEMVKADDEAVRYLKQYQLAFDNSRSGMYEMTLDGRVSNVNNAMVRIFGFSNAEEIFRHGDTLAKMLFSDPKEQFRTMLRSEEMFGEINFLRKDNKVLWVRHSAKLIFDDRGNWNIEGAVEDITQSKLKEMAVFEKEMQVAEKKIAEKSVSAKNEFLANMNHEIRTPLAAIIGFSESLKDKHISKQERTQAVDLVVGSSHTLLQLINDILDFSKIEANKLCIEEIPVNVSDVVDKVRHDFSLKAEKKNIRFDIVYRYPIPSLVLSDPTRLSQVLNNICANAVKFTDRGSVMLIVSWDEEANKLKFEVVDSGVGISDQIQDQLFQVFNQADTSATREYGGAGLGLAISKQLAMMMGGDIEVLSELGRGSVFTFTLGARFPQDMVWIRQDDLFNVVKSDGRKKKVGRKRKDNTAVGPLLTGNVLLAEDNIVNQKLIERVLKKFGLEVVVVSDGVEACDYCDECCGGSDIALDFVLMDINMPNRSGLEATKYLRSKKYALPIYALTAETSQEEVSKALDAGCDGFLTKPLDRKLLFNALSEHLLLDLPESK